MVSNSGQIIGLLLDELTNRLREAVSEEVNKAFTVLLNKQKCNEPELLTRKEAMELLGKSYPYLWRLNKQGILRSRKMGRSVYYYKQDIFNHLNQNEAA